MIKMMGILNTVRAPIRLNASGNPNIVRESLIVSARPRAMFSIPIVTTKAGIFQC